MKNVILICSLLLTSGFAFAHGEDKYGPHGGFIRMPGAFHTELVPVGKNKLKVFLLDIQWKNPSVVKSSVEISFKGNSATKAKCEVQENYYQCDFPNTIDLTKKGELKVVAQREEQKGMEVSYPLPLKLEVVDDGHGTHR